MPARLLRMLPDGLCRLLCCGWLGAVPTLLLLPSASLCLKAQLSLLPPAPECAACLLFVACAVCCFLPGASQCSFTCHLNRHLPALVPRLQAPTLPLSTPASFLSAADPSSARHMCALCGRLPHVYPH